MQDSASSARPTRVVESDGGRACKGDAEEDLRLQCAAFDIDYIEPGAPPYQIELQIKKKKKQAEAARERRRGALRKAIARARTAASAAEPAEPTTCASTQVAVASTSQPAAAAIAAAAGSYASQPDAAAERRRAPLARLPQQVAVLAALPQPCAHSKPRGRAFVGMDGEPCEWDTAAGGWRHRNGLWHTGNAKPEPLATATEALLRARTGGFVFGAVGGGSFAPSGTAFGSSVSGGLSFGSVAAAGSDRDLEPGVSGAALVGGGIASGMVAVANMVSFAPSAREPAAVLRDGPTLVSGFTFAELGGVGGGGGITGQHHRRPRGRAPVGRDGQTRVWHEDSGTWQSVAPPTTLSISCDRTRRPACELRGLR